MSVATSRPRAAIFVDAENQGDFCPKVLIRFLRDYQIVERHAYADWRNALDPLAERLAKTGFELHHTWSGRRPGSRKDIADSYMKRGIWRLLERYPDIDIVIIITGDQGFIKVVHRLQREGKYAVVGSAYGRISKGLSQAADLHLELNKAGITPQKRRPRQVREHTSPAHPHLGRPNRAYVSAVT